MSQSDQADGTGGGAEWTGWCEVRDVGGSPEWVYDMAAYDYAGDRLVRITLNSGEVLRAVVYQTVDEIAYAYAYAD